MCERKATRIFTGKDKLRLREPCISTLKFFTV